MSRLLLLFLNLCRLKAGPQDIPASSFLLGIAIAAYLAVSTLLLALEVDLLQALAQSVVDIALVGLFIGALLSLRGMRSRFTQTMTALAGSKTILELASWPLAWYLLHGGGEQDGFAGLMLLVLVFWVLSVLVHIFRHALSVGVGAGILLALGYLFLSFVVMTSLFPPSLPPAAPIAPVAG